MDGSLIDFFNDREIFITGGSGFLGKGLIEKILRSFNVSKIYVLLRPKKGVDPNKRLEELKKDQIFNVLRREKPKELDKLITIPGDVSQLNLDIPLSSIKLLQNVSIVLHSAATIRFDEPLKTAILINVRGTREVLRIAAKLPKLQMFLHISTLFSNCNLKFIDEKIYPAPMDWRNCIRIAEQVNDDDMRVFENKLTKGYPNTYTFTKSLSEHVVNDFHQTIPIVIIRPSIVLCSLFDPFPGYTDNVSGSTSVAVAGGTGLLRTFLCDPDMIPNQVSLDVVVRIAILSIWKAANDKIQKNPFICNITGELYPRYSIRRQLEIMKTIWKEIPYNKMFWKPAVFATRNKMIYHIRFFLFQLFPAISVDTILMLIGRKPILVKYQRIICGAMKGFQFFLSSPIVSGFSNMKMLSVESQKFPGFEAKNSFILDALEYGEIVATSCRRFIFKEKDSDLPKAKTLYKWFWLADVIFKLFLLFIFFTVVYSCLDWLT
ncbi:fatty acyl-CoA reductase wat-like [Episyrphus balteatus]|uniref:fatty acyl-CoA reductase wat-like n=1 Tax=Episyrphus balteatus TaxID=286459 RepID=UPI00248614E7|nr:fatty acyl-CoA reductase wat-like [Episyrphus balteatus]